MAELLIRSEAWGKNKRLSDLATDSGSGAYLLADKDGWGEARKVSLDSLQGGGASQVSVLDFASTAQKADIQDYTGALDVLDAVNLAQVALTELGGGTLLYPQGLYRLSSAIFCHDKIRHIGASRGSTIMWNVGEHATARLNDCFAIGTLSINDVGDFTGYAGTLSTDRRTLTLGAGAGANFAEGEGVFIGATATVDAGEVIPEAGFMSLIADITGDVITFDAPLAEVITAPKLFKFSGLDSNTGDSNHLAYNIEIGHFITKRGSIHNQCGYRIHIHDVSIRECRNFITWNAFCHSIIERVSGVYWNRACELKLYSHNSVLRDIWAHWYDGGGVTTPTTPVSFGECLNDVLVDNLNIYSDQTGVVAAYIASQHARKVKIINSRFAFPAMPASAGISLFDGLSTLAKVDGFIFENSYLSVGGSATRFVSVSDASPSNPAVNVSLQNNTFAGTISTPASAFNLLAGDSITILNNRVPSNAQVSVGAACTNVLQSSPSGLAILPVSLAAGVQANTRTALGTSASAGHLGVAAPYGSAAVTRSIASATTSEQAGWEVRIPDDWAEAGTVKFRLTMDVQNAPAQVSATVNISVKLVTNGGVGSELYGGIGTPTNINTATDTDYDLEWTPTNVEPGDRVVCQVTCAIDNTGGGATVTGRLFHLKLLYQSTLKGR